MIERSSSIRQFGAARRFRSTTFLLGVGDKGYLVKNHRGRSSVGITRA